MSPHVQFVSIALLFFLRICESAIIVGEPIAEEKEALVKLWNDLGFTQGFEGCCDDWGCKNTIGDTEAQAFVQCKDGGHVYKFAIWGFGAAIPALPDSFQDTLRALTELKSLSLAGNDFQEISLLPEMPTLKLLFLPNNQLRQITLPEGMANLNHLKLSGNQLKEITFPTGMTDLSHLYVSDNDLTKVLLPSDTTKCCEEMWIHNNPNLTCLPKVHSNPDWVVVFGDGDFVGDAAAVNSGNECIVPTSAPTRGPTSAPTSAPTTRGPTSAPTPAPSKSPTSAPTPAPSKSPTSAPTLHECYGLKRGYCVSARECEWLNFRCVLTTDKAPYDLYQHKCLSRKKTGQKDCLEIGCKRDCSPRPKTDIKCKK